MQVDPGISWYIILAAGVWIVYTTDHLADALKLKRKATAFRHIYHYKYRKILIPIASILSILTIISAWYFLDHRIFFFGLFMGVLVLIYLGFVFVHGRKQSRFIQKEMLVALIYSAGIWGGPMALVNFNLSSVQGMVFFLFLLAAFNNTTLLAWFEYETDRENNLASITTWLGRESTGKLVFITSSISSLYALIWIILFTPDLVELWAMIILLVMNIMMMLILLLKSFMTGKNRYKLWIEGVFWLPVVMILF